MTPSPKADDAEAFWRQRARQTIWKHRLGSFLDGFLPGLLAVSAAFACALLIVRQHGAAVRGWCVGYGAMLLVCVGFAAWLAGRRHAFGWEAALVRLEDHLGLHNRLSAAAAGVGAFPPPQPASDGYVFRWDRIVPPLAGAAVLVWAAAAVTVSRPSAAEFIPETLPTALAQTAGWLEALQQTNLVQPAAVEDLRARLEQLRRQPARDWYNQSSLEAGDHLRGQTEQSLQALGRDLRNAAGSLEAMGSVTAQANPAGAAAAAGRLREAVKGLELGNLPLNHELLSQLKDLDPAAIDNLSPKELAALKQRLKSGARTTEAVLGAAKPGEGSDKDALAPAADANGDPGAPGGPGGGKDGAALNYRDRPTDLESQRIESVPGTGNLAHALPGDLLGVGKGEHVVDPAAYQGPAPAGAIASEGTGGEAVWRDDLSPQEREVLRHFFR